MLIIGYDFHSRFQQIAMVDTDTGELIECRLDHSGEAQKFYAGLQKPVRVGMEATGYGQWFERMLAKLGYELWIGDAAEIRAAMVREQKTDARDQQPCGTDLPLEMPVCLAAAQDFAGSSRIRRIEISGYRNACRSQLISGALR